VNIINNIFVAKTEYFIVLICHFVVKDVGTSFFSTWKLDADQNNIKRFGKERFLEISHCLLHNVSKLVFKILVLFLDVCRLAFYQKLFLQGKHYLSIFVFGSSEVSVKPISCIAPQFLQGNPLTHSDEIVVHTKDSAKFFVARVIKAFKLL
jgi:hypothetical protein